MQFSQRLRRLLRGGQPGDERPTTEDATPPRGPRPPLLRTGSLAAAWVWLRWVLIAAVVVVALYYPLGAILDHRINDDPDFVPPAPPPGASHVVAAATALLTREVDETGWVANTPPFASNAMLKYGGNMMNFQIGITRAIATVNVELRDQLGRQRGSSAVDDDLRQAASDIQYDPERWIWRPGRILPETSADQQYRSARDHLLTYNERLSAGTAIFDARSDNLVAVLDRIALDIGASAADLDTQIAAGRNLLIDRQADKLFYLVKGKAYAYRILMRALRQDFAEVIETRGVADIYDQMLADLEVAATLQPLIVQNGSRDGIAANNHLATQGFYILLSRAKLREITNILRT